MVGRPLGFPHCLGIHCQASLGKNCLNMVEWLSFCFILNCGEGGSPSLLWHSLLIVEKEGPHLCAGTPPLLWRRTLPISALALPPYCGEGGSPSLLWCPLLIVEKEAPHLCSGTPPLYFACQCLITLQISCESLVHSGFFS